MRTGADYRESIKGRKLWILGEGKIDDITTHPATAPVVDEYVAWYDRHFDPLWQDTLLTSPDASGKRIPYAFLLPQSSADLRAMGKSFSATTFLNAGYITHTPAYGGLISIGVLDTLATWDKSSPETAKAAAYRDMVAETGKFVTLGGGGSPIGFRFRANPADRAGIRLIKETDAGIVISGKTSMFTAGPFAEAVYVGGGPSLGPDRKTSLMVDVDAPGVLMVSRKIAARHRNPFVAPFSSRFDELEAQMWLEDVFVPWEQVYVTDAPSEGAPNSISGRRNGGAVAWCHWHQLYCWLSKAELTLGLALALSDAMGLKENQQTIEYLVDMLVDVQTVRSCITAAEFDPEVTPGGFVLNGSVHMAAAQLAMMRTRQQIAETLRKLPGSSIVVTPADTDLLDPEMAQHLEEAFGGGGYTAMQRSAILHAAWDHVASGLDGRESAFELHANGGMPTWRGRLRAWFDRYNDLANRALGLLDLEMPRVDLNSIRDARSVGSTRQIRQPTVAPVDGARESPAASVTRSDP